MLFYIIPTILLHSDSRSCQTAIMSTYRDCWSAHHIMHIASRHIKSHHITLQRNRSHQKETQITTNQMETHITSNKQKKPSCCIKQKHKSHWVTSHCTKLNRNKHYITPTKNTHHTALHRIKTWRHKHHMASDRKTNHITVHDIASQQITLHCSASHHVTWHHIASNSSHHTTPFGSVLTFTEVNGN